MLLTEIYIGNAFDFCNCGNSTMVIEMRTTGLEEVSGYPVVVLNVNLDAIGIAADKDQYISIWNADAANAAVGYLEGFPGPFLFRMVLREGPMPDYVYGNPFDNGDFNNDFSDDFNNQ